MVVEGHISQSETGFSVFLGKGAGAMDDLTGNQNVFVGEDAGYSNTSGSHNTACGRAALNGNQSGDNNTACGSFALSNNETGNGNIAIGTNALAFNTAGNFNVASGVQTLLNNTIGSHNVAYGDNALGQNKTGHNNIGLGASAGYNITTGSSNILIGHNIYAQDTAGNEQLSVGNLIFATGGFGSGTTVGSGKVGIGEPAPACRLHIKQLGNNLGDGLRLEQPDSSNYWSIQTNDKQFNDLVFSYNSSATRAWISSIDGSYNHLSDRRLKQDINPIGPALDKVMQLKPVAYRFKSNPDDPLVSYGFIAQQLEEVYPEFVSENSGLKGLDYSNFSAIAIRAIQELQEKIKILQAENREMKDTLTTIQSLKEENDELRRMIQSISSKVEKTLQVETTALRHEH